MAIGYASKHVGSETTKISSTKLSHASEENLRKIILKNLRALEEIIHYNIRNHIHLFRISSDIIPFASHPANQIKWWTDYQENFQALGQIIRYGKIRVSMHPGQYTVLNSLNPDVARRAVKDLEYHCRFLDALECDQSSKIILHVGGVYSDKASSMERFILNYKRMNPQIKKRLVIENDDKSYTVQDVLQISEKTGIPVVFDNLHHQLNNTGGNSDEYPWLEACRKTWNSEDGKQKIHYSQQKSNGAPGAHSDFIRADEFLTFYQGLASKNLDTMLEVKDKNLSAIKCILLTDEHPKIQVLEHEWAKYKYFVLSRSARIYKDIRLCLKNKKSPDPLTFYHFIEEAITTPQDMGAEINAAEHIWGYLNTASSVRQKTRFHHLLNTCRKGQKPMKHLKNFLYKLAKEQSVEYLTDSLYFYL
jgi:UV DNA damage endonuclease